MTGFLTAVVGEVIIACCHRGFALAATCPGSHLTNNCYLQLLTGKGALGQLRLETSLPPAILKASIGAIVLFNLVTALLPQTTFSDENQADVRKRPAGTSI